MKMEKFIHSAGRALGIIGVVAALVIVSASPVLAAPPPNDNFASSEKIVTLPHTSTVNTGDATTESTDPTPSCGNQSKARSVWWSYTPTTSARLEANTLESSYDTILSVWTGSAGAMEQVACNDDLGRPQSQVYFDAAAGETYHFLVTSYGSDSGTLTFTLEQAPDETELNVAVEEVGWVNAFTGRATITGEITCSRQTEIELSLELAQDQGERTQRGYGYRTVDCDGTDRWQATVRGSFKEGFGGVDVTAYSREDRTIQASASGRLRLRACTMIGTLDDDVIRGTQRDDTICSMAGDDVINGGGGNDQIRGYDGNDVLIGNGGNDILNGGYGKDRLRGEAGTDLLYGDQDADNLNGGGGRDRCYGGASRDKFRSCEKQKQ